MKISAMIEFLRKNKGIAVPAIAALVAAFLAMGHIERKERELLGFAEPVEVITASEDIKAGDMISISAITRASVPRKFLTPRPIFNIVEAVGRVAAVTIPEGSQISQTFLLPEGEIPLSSIIPDGMRLVTLPLPESYGQMYISRGDRVDLIATFDLKENGSAKGASFHLVEGALVVAAGDRN
ncbi:MAG TPA: SAF domain-containing protein, partial [bacterium]|nr:SAF domain-containing protein [bacterium]